MNETADGRRSQPDECHLFAIPAELRNRIYRYAMIQDGDLTVTPRGPGEPALLRTCYVVRDEACSIYYGENQFLLHIEDWNGMKFHGFLRQYHKYAPRSSLRISENMSFLLLGSPNWDNLVAWIKQAHMDDTCSIPSFREDKDGPDDYLVAGIQQMLSSMTWDHVPWEKVEKALEGFYCALRGTNSAWVKPEDRVPH